MHLTWCDWAETVARTLRPQGGNDSPNTLVGRLQETDENMIKTVALTIMAMTVVAASITGANRASGSERVDYHYQLERALQEKRCIPASVETIWTKGQATAFEVTCWGRPRRLVVACDTRACRAENPGDHDQEEEER